MNKKFYIGICTLFLTLLTAAVTSHATPPGQLDTTFGTNGIVTTQVGTSTNYVNAVAIQSNGRIVAAGESDGQNPGVRRFATARYFGDAAENFDYDRDGYSDISVFRPSEGNWYVLGSSAGSMFGADYDGDGRADAAVYRDGIWHIQQSTAGSRTVSFGSATDLPTPTAYLP